MNTRSLLFALFGLALITGVFLMLYKESYREWKIYQRAFQAAASNDSGSSQSDGQTRNVQLRQIYLEELGRTDRCITCHLGIDDPSWKEAENPYKTHPGDYLLKHPVERYGCTVCHEGQGLATTKEDAHRGGKGWSWPLIPWDYIEAACGRCHKESRVPRAPVLNRGRMFFEKAGCPGCHKVKGVYENWQRASSIHYAGSKLKRPWLIEYLSNPEEREEEIWEPSEGTDTATRTHDPNFKLSPDEVESIASYLMGLKDPRIPSHDPGSSADPARIEEGKRLLLQLGCTTCHRVPAVSPKDPSPMELPGGDLSVTGSKLNRHWLESYLKDPSSFQPDSKKPAYRLKSGQIKEIADYLMSLRDKRLEIQRKLQGASPEVSADRGRTLIVKYNCIGCHDIKGIAEGEKGPELSGIGSKPVSRLDYGENPPGTERTLPNWLFAKVMTPRVFRHTLKMPYPRITKEETTAVVTYLLSLTKEDIPSRYTVKGASSSGRNPLPKGGEVGRLISELKCGQCHSFDGTHSKLAPDLSFEGTRARRDWLVSFLKDPRPIRPLLGARMPVFQLSSREASLLADFIQMLLQREISGEEQVESEIRKGSPKRGEGLFFQTLACSGCHRIRGRGGRVGPELTRAGARLNSRWIYMWLADPQAFDPSTPMPNPMLSKSQIADLTRFLETLK